MRRPPPTTITGACRSRSRCMPQSAKFGVFEIGMNHAGEITPLTQLVRPHVAIVTTIAPVHLEFFGTLDAIADAKAEIFLGRRAGRRSHHQCRRRRSSHVLPPPRRRPASKQIVSFGERKRGRARAQSLAAGRDLDRAGEHPRARRDLQARRAGPPCGRQFARGARRRASARRGPCACGTCARPT